MRWTSKPRDITKPHRWFAWYPVRIARFPNGTEKWAWLEYVERVFVPDPSASGANDNSKWDYRYLVSPHRFL